jgi:anaerobic magnesium-protoporphyrin IX monomethyl ester cyclase
MAKVLFVQDVLFESFGPEYMSAVARQGGHEVELFIQSVDGNRNFVRKLRQYRPDVVAFSITSFGFRWSLDAAAVAKKEIGALTVFGGAHPTFARDFVSTHSEVDLACKGEGEGAFLDLCNAVDRHEDPTNIPNMISRNSDGTLKAMPLRPLIADLDTIPFADRSLHFKYKTLRDLPYKRFIAGRGCPYKCTYCFNLAQKEMYQDLGKYVRFRSPENLLEEILHIKKNYGIGTVGFVDDTFTVNRKWLLEFLELYRRDVRLPFTAMVRANELKEDVAEALGRSGCRYVSFGLEVGNEKIRNTILGRNMTNDQIRNAAHLLHKYNVKFLTFNMFGAPGETKEDGLQTIRLNAEIRTDLVGASVFQPLIGTESWSYCVREGYLDRKYDVESIDRITLNSPLNKMPDIKYLERLQKIGFIGVHKPRLIPLVDRLARIPLGPLYGLAYKFSMFLRFKLRFGLTLMDMVKMSLRSGGRFS